MDLIFGSMGSLAPHDSLCSVAESQGESLHTLHLGSSMLGMACKGGVCCPRRCVWQKLDCAIVLNGRLTNRSELIRLAHRCGFPLTDADDAELALALYMLFGQECVQMMHGAFAFAVFDYTQSILFLARDRLGLEPLWFAHQGETLVFASSAKFLLNLEGISRTVTRQGLWQLALAPAPVGNVFRDVQIFPAGHTAIFRSGHLTIRRSWFLRPRTCCDAPMRTCEKLALLRRQAMEAYGEGGMLLQFPHEVCEPGDALFAASVQAADLPGEISPAVLTLLKHQSHQSPFALCDLGRGGFPETPIEPADYSLLDSDALQLSSALAWLQRRRPLPQGGDSLTTVRSARRRALGDVILPKAACWRAMGQAADLQVYFPFLDHRLLEYTYNLPTPDRPWEHLPEPLPQSAFAALLAPDSPLGAFLHPRAIESAAESGQNRALLTRLALLNAWAAANEICFE